ncbi:cytochrome P450 [Suillus discolor]|uniref:Cytochrome P450 n=1 Tax=Suillus discolor TaxID=1912936 RepID=A0A9P7JPK5_9AGAM|nr:cytochrome P450 [Suillus discolor]KAG2096080.1 cytochrome P450 [Suillus discolor]
MNLFAIPSPSSLWTTVRSGGAINAACSFAALWALVKVLRMLRWRVKTTQLLGPPRTSLVYGVSRDLASSHDRAATYERWATEYGVVYMIPSVLGQTNVVLCDPKAIAHFYARETWTYVKTPLTLAFLESSIGKGLLWSQGETHRRQRKALTPAFSNAAIRKLTSVFYDSAYKAKGQWDNVIESSKDDDAVIEVQNWMNHISLDTVGIAGFSHDFGSLDGKRVSVAEAFDTLGSNQPSAVDTAVFLLASVFPIILKIPNKRQNLFKKLGITMEQISNELLIRSRREKDADMSQGGEENSLIGLLIKSEGQDAELHMSVEEVVAQMKVLLLAGYETTSISLTWALIELSRHSDVQTRLREELLAFGPDPTYDQLKANLPYLDAVVHETLRLHPPDTTTLSPQAAEDDVLPLSEPVRTMSGNMTDSISIAKGTLITISMEAINRSLAIWGPDAKEFKPERWLTEDGISGKAKEVQGHRHLLTFVDGPRACLGKDFAIIEFKTVVSVLVKNFVFEMRDGPDTPVEVVRGVLSRPRVVGEDGTGVPLRVRRYE